MDESYKLSFQNPYSLRLLLNNSSDVYNYQQTNVLDGFYDGAMNKATEGSFPAICLSGMTSEDNQGGSQSIMDALVDYTGHARVILRPLTPFGKMYPDPLLGANFIDINQRILSHAALYSAKSDFRVDGMKNMPQFGQIVNAYWKEGRIADTTWTELRFSQPEEVDHDDRYLELATREGVQTAFDAFAGAGGNGQLMGSLPQDKIDPAYKPPREWLYIGTDERYYNTIVQNGNLPDELMAKTDIKKRGARYELLMLKEIIPDFHALVDAFNKQFPWGRLGGTQSYRSYKQQLRARKNKGNLTADPGTSTHGWAQAVDISYYFPGDTSGNGGKMKSRTFSYNKVYDKELRVKNKETRKYEILGPNKLELYEWMEENAPKYNWHSPRWARKGALTRSGKSKEEPWHWESTRTIFINPNKV